MGSERGCSSSELCHRIGVNYQACFPYFTRQDYLILREGKLPTQMQVFQRELGRGNTPGEGAHVKIERLGSSLGDVGGVAVLPHHHHAWLW